MIWIFFPFFLFAGVIENNISKVYKEAYPTINIKNIILSKNIKKPIHLIDISNINIKRNSGTIKVNNLYLFYKLDASIKVLKSTNIINKNEKLTTTNTILKQIPFKGFYSPPLTSYTNNVAKMYIPKNAIIYDYMITTANAIQKGEKINIISNSGGIEISFQAISLQNGKPGDIIKVKKGKQIFCVTIDKNGNGRL